MTHYFITGTSSGIGKALTELILEKEEAFVTGFSRRNSIHHSRYRHIHLDLADVSAVGQFSFPVLDKCQKVVLVNNAGFIGDIKRQGRADGKAIVDAYTVNLISPALLTNSFLAQYGEHPATKVILNVSSGAGKRPIDAWAPYCSSKAGLDLLSLTTAEEQSFLQNKTHIYSIAPGIVDTEMQGVIRDSNPTDFKNHADFVSFKENNELVSSEEVAQKYWKIIQHPEEYPETIFSLRDID